MTTITMPLFIPFDILGYFERLKDAGVSEPQAKVQAEALQTVLQACEEGVRKVSESTMREAASTIRADLRDELATKGDMREESIAIRADLRETALRLQKEIKETELRLQKEMKEIELHLVTQTEASKHEMIKWYIGMSIAQLGVIVGILATFYTILR